MLQCVGIVHTIFYNKSIMSIKESEENGKNIGLKKIWD